MDARVKVLKTRVASSMYAQLMSSLNHPGSNPTQYFQDAMKFLDVQKAAGINPYPHKFSVTMTITDFREKYAGLKNGEGLEDKDQVSLAGRIMTKRLSSSKLIFYDVHGGGASIQVVFDANACQLEEAEVTKFHSSVNCFDIVGITGFPGKTDRGVLSIFVKSVNSFVVLSHCLHELPKRSVKKGQVWAPGNIRNPDVYTLNDVETRYSQRFLDLMLNEEVREVFKMRSKVIVYIRKFLDNLDFLEVETPIMSANSGGAHLFITYHNELNMKLCMRSTPDVFLKQLVVGGLDRVYEIGKQFSNEAIDDSHNPEFTTCKLYRAYADYNDMIELTENLLSGMVKELTGRYVIKCHSNGRDKAPVDIDFRPPFRKINVIRELEKVANISIPSDLASEEANRHLMDACAKYGVPCTPPHTTVRLLNKLVSHFLEQTCVNPTFIMEYPDMTSPLAKCHRSKPGLTEYFELFVNKRVLCKGCTEINDPLLQHQQSSDSRSGKRAVDLDDSCCTAQACTERNDPLLQQQQSSDPQSSKGAVGLNDSCCTALEYGLPPSASWELSIDNLAMLLSDSQRMQEVLLFPAMKPHVEPHCHESPLPSFFRIVVVGDTHEDWALLEDSIALHFLQPDLVMFTGDFGNENVELVKSVSQLNFPKVAILGNHDSWTTYKFKKVKDGVQLQLEYLGEAHVGYNNVDFPTLNLSVIGGRPFSCGGNQLFRNKLLSARYGIRSMEESAERIYKVAQRTPKENSIIFLAHNGPEGLGSSKDDICGLDFKPGDGDFGDPDLSQAIKQLKETTSYRIPLVVFGHMHKELKCGGSRKMIAFGADDTMYLNAAIVPRVKYVNARCSSRAFTVVEFSDGKITKVTESWVSIIDDKASLEEEHLLYSNGFENETNS